MKAYRGPKQSTKERLAEALTQASAPAAMIQRARHGDYDDYESELGTPIVQLVRDCQAAGLPALAQRAINGEFDGTKEEADAWFAREGRHLLDGQRNGEGDELG